MPASCQLPRESSSRRETTRPRRQAVREPDGHAVPVSERLRTIVEQLQLRPDDRVLEIGCGHGVAATFVLERLVGGRLTAIDRSRTMIAAAVRRNAAAVEAGTAEFIVGSLETIDLGERRFDVGFAVRVGLFRREPERATTLAARWLAPGGRLLVFYDEPGASG